MRLGHLLLALALAGPAAGQDKGSAAASLDAAVAFGTRPMASHLSLSPDGKRIVYLAPLKGNGTAVIVADIGGTGPKPIFAGGGVGKPVPIWCRWKSEARLICKVYGITEQTGRKQPYTRIVAMNADGTGQTMIGQRNDSKALQTNFSSGNILNWLPDDPEHVLMQIYIPERETIGSLIKAPTAGLSVQKVNIASNRMTPIEPGKPQVRGFDTDLKGEVRLMATIDDRDGYLQDKLSYFVRPKSGGGWQKLAETDIRDLYGLTALSFDESGDHVYALMRREGRLALFKIAADGSKRTELVYAHPEVDVENLVYVGKYNRPVGVSYVAEVRHHHYFDPGSDKLSRSLRAAMPGKPEVTIVDESWDGTAKLIYAGTGTEPGGYYLFSSKTRQLGELVMLRPPLIGRQLGEVRAISYPARDGTTIPGYLTLPPGSNGRNLPTIVMPHGGPESRDDGGFDWWAQFYAAKGYAVLQPNFRGSTGYGEAYYNKNGFRSWPTAIGDVNDGTKWLVAQGIADPARVAAVGWSYGGYAVLQANVLDPGLYKAVVAVAPVTDLVQWREDASKYATARVERDRIGDGPHVVAGSPARHAGVFRAPVQLFHGDLDLNVDIKQSRAMAAALKSAGKPVELVVYPGLAHSLDDSSARIDMLTKSAAFLAANLGGAGR